MGFRSSYNNPVGMFAMGKKKIVKYENNNNNHAMSNVLQRKIHWLSLPQLVSNSNLQSCDLEI